MIDIVATKNRILEMAIHGELVPHRGTVRQVDGILSNIEIEVKDLEKKRETKISKTAEMLSDDIFDIPENWKWVPLGKLCIMLSRGKSPKYSEKKKYPVFAQKCNQPNELALWKALFLDETTLDKWPEYFRLRNDDVVINSTGTGTVGRIGFYTNETLNPKYPFMLPDSHVTVVRVGQGIISKYIYYTLRTATLQTIMEKTFRGSTNQKEFYIDSVYAIPIPVPPTEEQELIVKKLDEVFSLLEMIEKYQMQYKADLDILKAKLIEAGIQGKLTEHLPEDGTAEEVYKDIQDEKERLIKQGKIKKEKVLPDISITEIPFDIPTNWKWVRLNSIGSWSAGATPSRGNKEYYTGNIPWVKTGELQNGIIRNTEEHISELALNECSVRLNPIGSVLLAMYGATIGKVGILEIEATTNQACCACIPYRGIYNKYLFYYLLAHKNDFILRSHGGAQPNISKEIIISEIFPLPPFAEQKRIVERIEELLSII